MMATRWRPTATGTRPYPYVAGCRSYLAHDARRKRGLVAAVAAVAGLSGVPNACSTCVFHAIQSPVPRPSGQAVGAQRRSGGIVGPGWLRDYLAMESQGTIDSPYKLFRQASYGSRSRWHR